MIRLRHAATIAFTVAATTAGCSGATRFEDCPKPITCYASADCATNKEAVATLVCATSCAAAGMNALVGCVADACSSTEAPTLVCAKCDPETGAGCNCPAGKLTDAQYGAKCSGSAPDSGAPPADASAVDATAVSDASPGTDAAPSDAGRD